MEKISLKVFLARTVFVFAIFLFAQNAFFKTPLASAAAILPSETAPSLAPPSLNMPTTIQCANPGPAPNCGASSAPFQCDSFSAYRCANNSCGRDLAASSQNYSIEKGTGYYECVTSHAPYQTTDSNGCAAWSCESFTARSSGPYYNTQTQPVAGSIPGAYQICPSSSNNWGPDMPAYQCAGTCYPAPEVKNLDDASLSPKNAFDGSHNAKLPVNIGWQDNVEKTVAKTKNSDNSFCSVESYQYTIPRTGQNDFVGQTNSKNAIVSEDACTLNSNSQYTASVQACANGTCGQNGTLPFNTSAAPQLLLPYDSDWENSQNATALSPTTLQWCPLANAKTYAVNLYQKETNGSQTLVAASLVAAPQTNFTDADFLNSSLQNFQNNVLYFWKIASCNDTKGNACSPFSQYWSFIPSIGLTPPTLQSPSFDPAQATSVPAVNLLDNLSWTTPDLHATHFLLHVESETAQKSLSKDYFTQSPQYPIQNLWKDLGINSTYNWKVASCGGTNFSACDNQSAWSEQWKFKTTGSPPTNLATKPLQSGQTAIPATLYWDAMPGAASYAWEISSDPSFSTIAARSVAQEAQDTATALKENTHYWWHVKTCADPTGSACGNWASSNFMTVALVPPIISSPQQNKDEYIPQANAIWGAVYGGNYYSYSVKYLTLDKTETSTSCKNSTGTVVDENIISQTTAVLNIKCKGMYQLLVASCIDQKCSQKGPLAAQSFTVKELPVHASNIIPCGLAVDNPKTSWDEREPCQLKHIVLLVRNLVDFLLWRIAPAIILLYGVLTGASIYFSLGNTIQFFANLKSRWKAVGIGVLILLFAWFLLNIVLIIVGFNVNIFGHWYILPT